MSGPHPRPAASRARSDDVFPKETPYGIRVRLEYFYERIADAAAEVRGRTRVLEIGCGTGGLVTKPLARSLPDIDFLGIDIHEPSIEAARRDAPPNTSFEAVRVADLGARVFDVVICSEVLEHLTDPPRMVADLKRVLSPRGMALVTIPNGYGPKEIEDLLKRTLVKLVPYLRRYLSSTNHTVASLNPAGHVQFFTMERFTTMVREEGLEVEEYRGRRFLGGPISSRLLVTRGLRRWNTTLGRRLPSWAVSSWMFTLRRSAP